MKNKIAIITIDSKLDDDILNYILDNKGSKDSPSVLLGSDIYEAIAKYSMFNNFDMKELDSVLDDERIEDEIISRTFRVPKEEYLEFKKIVTSESMTVTSALNLHMLKTIEESKNKS